MLGLQPAGNKGKQGHDPHVEGAIGGFRYHVKHINVRVQADCTAESTVIWRQMNDFVEGDSGAVLIGTRTKREENSRSRWELTSFQSSTLLGDNLECPSDPFTSHYWKLAGRPYNDLMRKYFALIPITVLRDLDHLLEDSQDVYDAS